MSAASRRADAASAASDDEGDSSSGFEGCDVCLDDNASAADPLVYCEKCDAGVHKECFGYPLVNKIPDDEWLCARCAAGEPQAACILCPERGGIMKRTTDFRWAHISCASWIPECYFRQPEGVEPIDCCKIPPARFNQACDYCDSKNGVVLQCSEFKCKATFHVTCGRRNNIYLEFKVGKGAATDIVVSLCKAHAARWNDGDNKLKAIFKARDD